MQNLKQSFTRDMSLDVEYKALVVAIELPSGAIEIISNTEYINNKADYYIQNYDNDFRLKANPDVRVVGYMVV